MLEKYICINNDGHDILKLLKVYNIDTGYKNSIVRQQYYAIYDMYDLFVAYVDSSLHVENYFVCYDKYILDERDRKIKEII